MPGDDPGNGTGEDPCEGGCEEHELQGICHDGSHYDLCLVPIAFRCDLGGPHVVSHKEKPAMEYEIHSHTPPDLDEIFTTLYMHKDDCKAPQSMLMYEMYIMPECEEEDDDDDDDNPPV